MTEIQHISPLFTGFFLYIEPLFAFLGGLQAAFTPTQYLSFFTPLPVPSIPAPFQIPLDQLGACYVLFAWNEAITLRFTKDYRVWQAIIAGIALCDILHLAGAWREMGTAVVLNPSMWRSKDWVNMLLLWPPLAMRLSFVMGFGVEVEKQGFNKKTH